MDNIMLIRGVAAVCFIVILFVLVQRRRKRVR